MQRQATDGRARVLALLARLGLHVHPTKGAAVGTTARGVLGYTRRCLVLLAPNRRKRSVGAVHSLLRAACRDHREVRTMALHRFCCLAASASLALPLCRFRLRSLYSGVAVYRSRSRVPGRALQDLLWWTALGSGVDVGRAKIEAPVRVEFATEASDYGWGTVRDNLTPAQGFFSVNASSFHIILKELLAIILAMYCFPDLRGPGIVRVLTDSRVVMGIANAMSSPSPVLMRDMRRLHALLRARGLLAEAAWILSVENK